MNPLGDAHNLPLPPAVADIVILNATIHHCEHMARVIEEAGRLVAPGGLLGAITTRSAAHGFQRARHVALERAADALLLEQARVPLLA